VSGSLAARNYAAALFQLAAETGSEAELDGQLAAVAAALAGDRESAELFASRLLSGSAKRALIARALEGRVDRRLVGLCWLLAGRGRLALLPQITAEHHRALESSRGREEAVVETARPLSEAELDSVRRSLEQSLRQTLRIAQRVEPGLIGGLRVTVDGTQYELSLAGGLAQLAARLRRRW
jgi:F-type H+-transporting ATPase subunit delta